MPLERHTVQLFIVYTRNKQIQSRVIPSPIHSFILSVNRLEKANLNANIYICIYNKLITVTHILIMSKRP